MYRNFGIFICLLAWSLSTYGSVAPQSIQSQAKEKLAQIDQEQLRLDPTYLKIMELCRQSNNFHEFLERSLSYIGLTLQASKDVILLPLNLEHVVILGYQQGLSDHASQMVDSDSLARAIGDCHLSGSTMGVRGFQNSVRTADYLGKALSIFAIFALVMIARGKNLPSPLQKVKDSYNNYKKEHPTVCKIALGTSMTLSGALMIPQLVTLGNYFFNKARRGAEDKKLKDVADSHIQVNSADALNELHDAQDKYQRAHDKLSHLDPKSPEYEKAFEESNEYEVVIYALKQALHGAP